MKKLLQKFARSASRFLEIFAVTSITFTFLYFIYLIFVETVNGNFWAGYIKIGGIDIWLVLEITMFFLIFSALTILFQLLVTRYIFLERKFSGFTKISLRFLAGLPVFIILSVFLNIPELKYIEFLRSDMFFAIALSLAVVPTGLLILTEMLDDDNPSVQGAYTLGLPKDFVYWRIVLREQRRLVLIAVSVSIVRVLAEITVLFNLKQISIDFVKEGDAELIYATADLLAQSINAGDNIVLIVVILFLSLIGKIAVIGAATMMK